MSGTDRTGGSGGAGVIEPPPPDGASTDRPTAGVPGARWAVGSHGPAGAAPPGLYGPAGTSPYGPQASGATRRLADQGAAWGPYAVARSNPFGVGHLRPRRGARIRAVLLALLYVGVAGAVIAGAIALWAPEEGLDSVSLASSGDLLSDTASDIDGDATGGPSAVVDDLVSDSQATSTTTPPAVTPEGVPVGDRTKVDSGVGVVWTMSVPPEQDRIDVPALGGPELPGTIWTARVSGDRGEIVTVLSLDGRPLDLDVAIRAFVANIGADVGPISDATLGPVAARTAPFGNDAGQHGRTTAAIAGDRLILVLTLGRSVEEVDQMEDAIARSFEIA